MNTDNDANPICPNIIDVSYCPMKYNTIESSNPKAFKSLILISETVRKHCRCIVLSLQCCSPLAMMPSYADTLVYGLYLAWPPFGMKGTSLRCKIKSLEIRPAIASTSIDSTSIASTSIASTISHHADADTSITSTISESRLEYLVRTLRATPHFLQGVFPFAGRGVYDLVPLHETLSYVVPDRKKLRSFIFAREMSPMICSI